TIEPEAECDRTSTRRQGESAQPCRLAPAPKWSAAFRRLRTNLTGGAGRGVAVRDSSYWAGRARPAGGPLPMSSPCEDFGRPASPTRPGPLLCTGCRERDEQAQKRWDDVARSGRPWDTSRDDPWWKEWLTSRELFAAYHDNAPRLGEQIGRLLGG